MTPEIHDDWQHLPAPLHDYLLVGPSVLGKLLGRATRSIKLDVHRAPQSLPPRFSVPGSNKLAWRIKEIKEWMDALAELQAERRVAQAANKPFHLGSKSVGERATARMQEKRQ
jgi:hypothetical protein